MKPGSYSDPKTLAKLQHLKLRTEAVLDSLLKGQHLNPRPGFSIEFAQHREYSPGDDIRFLDWKAYARTDRFYVKEFQDETSLTCYLAVDDSASMSYQGRDAAWSKFDFSACLASALASIVIRQRDAVGLDILGQSNVSITPSDDPGQWNLILSALEASPNDATQRDGTEAQWLEALTRLGERIHQRGVLFLISDWLDDLEPLDIALRQLRESLKMDVRVVHILDQEELSPTLQGAVEFQALEGRGRLQVRVDQLLDAYRVEVADYLAELERCCQRNGVTYHRATTDESLVPVLQRVLGR